LHILLNPKVVQYLPPKQIHKFTNALNQAMEWLLAHPEGEDDEDDDDDEVMDQGGDVLLIFYFL